MRALLLALAATIASPAFAEPTNAGTLKEATTHGVVILTNDFEIDVNFTPDGRFKALGGLSKGSWKIDGDKLCSTADETQIETCSVYPAGKKSGDAFEIPAPGGRVSVRIK